MRRALLVSRACAVAGGGGGAGGAARSRCAHCCSYWRAAFAPLRPIGRSRSVASSARSVPLSSFSSPTPSTPSTPSSPPPPTPLLPTPPPIEPGSRAGGRMQASSFSSSPSSSSSRSSRGRRGLSSGFPASSDENADADGERRLVLIDGTALLYRCYFSLGAGGAGGGARLTSQLTGQDTSVAHGFVAQVLRLLELDPPPTHAAAVFDAPGKTFRHALYPEYKGHRPPSPPAVSAAAPMVRSLLRTSLGVADLSAPGVEADDLIGTLAVRAVREGFRVAVVSPDKDFYQLLRPGLQLLRPVPTNAFNSSSSKNSSLSVVTVAGLVPYTEATFRAEQNGLEPSQWADARALAGDPSDNVPGVAGIGAVTAASLIKEFGSLEELIERAPEIKKPPRARNALTSEEGIRAARLSRRLLEIRTDLDLPPATLPWESLELRSPATAAEEEAAAEREGDGGGGGGGGGGGLDGEEAKARALRALRELEMETSASRLEAVWEAMEARERVFGMRTTRTRTGSGGGLGAMLRPASELLMPPSSTTAATSSPAPPPPLPTPRADAA